MGAVGSSSVSERAWSDEIFSIWTYYSSDLVRISWFIESKVIIRLTYRCESSMKSAPLRAGMDEHKTYSTLYTKPRSPIARLVWRGKTSAQNKYVTRTCIRLLRGNFRTDTRISVSVLNSGGSKFHHIVFSLQSYYLGKIHYKEKHLCKNTYSRFFPGKLSYFRGVGILLYCHFFPVGNFTLENHSHSSGEKKYYRERNN